MKFIVTATPNPAVDRGPIQADESAVVGRLRELGVIEQIYVRPDGISLTVLEAESPAEAQGHIESLPFYQHKALFIDLVEVRVAY
jgi:hypothetical protein